MIIRSGLMRDTTNRGKDELGFSGGNLGQNVGTTKDHIFSVDIKILNFIL